MDGDVAVRLLGAFSVTVDGVMVASDDFTRRSGAELVQLLALAPGCRRHREQVFDALWPDVVIDRAANRLYQAASHARRALGSADAIVLRGEMVTLFPGRDVAVDAAILEAASPDDPQTVAAALEAWGGELLAEAPYAEWAGEARGRARQKYLELLAATGRWRTTVELDPTNELAHVALMRQDLELGNAHGALSRFDELDRLLEVELGMTPGPAAIAVRDDANTLLAQPVGVPAPVAGLRAFLVVDADPMDGPHLAVGYGTALSKAIEGAGGLVFDERSDQVKAVFASAANAVIGAVAWLRLVQQVSAEDQRRPSVRLGIDVGEAERIGEGWSGRVVDRAAAIAAAGSGGQIVCSSLVAELAGPDLGDEARVVELGLFRLPDQAPVRLARVVAAGIEDRKSPLRVSRVSGRHLAAAGDPLFGRDGELEHLASDLEAARIVTVVGAGGCGKTHLARHAATRSTGDYPGGVWLCELGSVSDNDGAAAEVLAAIGGQRHTDATEIESIIRTLGDRSMLVVLDNCEHLLDGVGLLSEEILYRCPEVRLLATSREPLGVSGEVVVLLGELDRAASVELFCAEAKRHGVELDPEEPTVARICQRLDDLPLALRLAAARARVLDVSEIEDRLADRLDAFRSPLRMEVPHHRTLRAAIAWSVDALDPGLRGVLVDLSMLANRFTLDAAVAVASRHGMTHGEVLDHFDELVRRSLVSGPERIGEQASYRLLESVRLFARELAADDGAAGRHLEYFVGRAEQSDAMARDQPGTSLRRIDADWDDIRRARQHAVGWGRFDDLVRLLAGVAFSASTRLRFEYLDWCEESLADPDDGGPIEVDSGAQTRAMGGWAHLVCLRGDMRRAIAIADRAYGFNPDDDLVLYALGLGHLWASTDTAMAERYLSEVVEDRSGAAGTRRAAALMVLTILGLRDGVDTSSYIHQLEVLAGTGGEHYRALLKLALGHYLMPSDPPGALEALEDAVAISEENGMGHVSANARDAIAEFLSRVGTIQQSLEATRQVLVWYVDRGMWTMATGQAVAVTALLERVGRDDIATTLLSAYQASPVRTVKWFERYRVRRAGLEERNPDDFDTWWASGQALDPPAACALAISTIDMELTALQAKPATGPEHRLQP